MNDIEEELSHNATTKLKEEVNTWSRFSDSLRLEDRLVFKEMIEKIWDYSDSVEICLDEHVTEAFLLCLLISQQKQINFLSNQIALIQANESASD